MQGVGGRAAGWHLAGLTALLNEVPNVFPEGVVLGRLHYCGTLLLSGPVHLGNKGCPILFATSLIILCARIPKKHTVQNLLTQTKNRVQKFGEFRSGNFWGWQVQEIVLKKIVLLFSGFWHIGK